MSELRSDIEKAIRVGRGKADASRTKGRGALGLTRKDKLKLGKSAAKDLIAGVRRANLDKRKRDMRKKK
jgi:hypothetical protein